MLRGKAATLLSSDILSDVDLVDQFLGLHSQYPPRAVLEVPPQQCLVFELTWHSLTLATVFESPGTPGKERLKQSHIGDIRTTKTQNAHHLRLNRERNNWNTDTILSRTVKFD